MTISSNVPPPKPLERVMIFIDGGYLRKLFNDRFGHDNIDYRKVSKSLVDWYNGFPQNPFRANLIRTYYYDGIVDEKEDSVTYAKQREYYDGIKIKFNISLVLGEAVKKGDERLEQKGVDILLALDSISMAYQGHYDSGLFLLGDRDFVPLIGAVKSTGKKTFGFFYEKNVSRELSWEFDFRLAFNKTIMQKWVSTT